MSLEIISIGLRSRRRDSPKHHSTPVFVLISTLWPPSSRLPRSKRDRLKRRNFHAKNRHSIMRTPFMQLKPSGKQGLSPSSLRLPCITRMLVFAFLPSSRLDPNAAQAPLLYRTLPQQRERSDFVSLYTAMPHLTGAATTCF